MKTSSFHVLAILLLSIDLACSSSTPSAEPPVDAGAHDDAVVSSPPPTTDAGGPDATVSDDAALDAGPPCNDVAVAAPSVDYSLSSLASPAAATAGSIVDGTYYLTAYTVYGAGSVGSGFVANQATSLTLEVAGDAWSQVQVFSIEGTTSTVYSNFTVTTSDASITLTPSCPSGAPMSGTYSATPTTIQLVSQTSGFVVSEIFAKQ